MMSSLNKDVLLLRYLKEINDKKLWGFYMSLVTHGHVAAKVDKGLITVLFL